MHAAWSDASRGDLRPTGPGPRRRRAAGRLRRRGRRAERCPLRPGGLGHPGPRPPGRGRLAGTVGAGRPPVAARRAATSVRPTPWWPSLPAPSLVRAHGRLRPPGARQPRRGVRRRPRRLAGSGGRRGGRRPCGGCATWGRPMCAACSGPASTPAATSSGTPTSTRWPTPSARRCAGPPRDGAPALDLVAGVRAATAAAGAELVGVIDSCTACAGGQFSHRARADRGRQALVVWSTHPWGSP